MLFVRFLTPEMSQGGRGSTLIHYFMFTTFPATDKITDQLTESKSWLSPDECTRQDKITILLRRVLFVQWRQQILEARTHAHLRVAMPLSELWPHSAHWAHVERLPRLRWRLVRNIWLPGRLYSRPNYETVFVSNQIHSWNNTATPETECLSIRTFNLKNYWMNWDEIELKSIYYEAAHRENKWITT
jgi:hypothetical protein